MVEIMKMFSEISDEELKEAIAEIKESQTAKFLKEDGVVRKYEKLTSEITGYQTPNNLFTTTVGILQEGAYRWIA